MTTLREAAQQALEVLCCVRDMVAHPDNLEFIDKHITALKAALAEPVQAQPVCDECGKSKQDGWALYCVSCVEPMFAPPLNLNDPAVQKRLAAQWGYVKEEDSDA